MNNLFKKFRIHFIVIRVQKKGVHYRRNHLNIEMEYLPIK